MRAQDSLTPIIYFPVKPVPLQMEAGFYPLGKDLGGGELDQYCFLKDQDFDHYINNKRRVEKDRHWVNWRLENHHLGAFHHLALETLLRVQTEGLGLPTPSQFEEDFSSFTEWSLHRKDERDNEHYEAWGTQLYYELTMRVQEDITVLANEPYSALVMGHICTPSFWDPRHVKNASFWDIHQPVPGFPRDERVALRLADHIARRGPFVRFVWTLCADDKLDHHPHHPRISWKEADTVWYRVERQITVPLEGKGALFLIRSYVHPLQRLSLAQRHILREAIEVMPHDISTYKGLTGLKARRDLLNQISPH
jgi:dimethylamine monooxygenase subunit A